MLSTSCYMYGYTSGVVCFVHVYTALTINPEYRERRGKCISFVVSVSLSTDNIVWYLLRTCTCISCVKIVFNRISKSVSMCVV